MRVVEFAGSGDSLAAAYAGWLLAEMGADVVRVAGAGGTATTATSPIALAREALMSGKPTIEAPRAQADLVELLGDFDVLLTDDPSRLISDFDFDPRVPMRIRSMTPRLIVGVASIFGLDGPNANVPATELDAQALSAVAWSLGEPARSPLSLPPGIAAHQAGAMLAAGVLAALASLERNGCGRVVDVALADVLASYVAGNCRLYIHHGLAWHRSGRRASGSGGAYPYVILPCKDGAVCLCGRTREEWKRFVGAMGNPAWAFEPRYQSLRAMGTRYPDEVDAHVMPWLAQRTKAELELIALENNLIVSPIRTFGEVLATRQFAERGFLREETIAGHAVRTPGLPFRVTGERSASAVDFAQTMLRNDSSRSRANDIDRANHETSAGPLAGLRVLDFGWVWSAPWVGTLLGELGAEVIKVEHALRPDNLRLAGRVYRDGVAIDGPTTEMSPMFHQVNHGKLGITLNTKSPRAVELAKALVATSDIVLENMSPGSMERVGLGYDALRAVNPRVVMLAMSAAGQFGPQSSMRAYAPTMSSFVGMEALVGYRGEAPIGALNFGLGDPNASAHGMVAILAALRRVKATGNGCYIDLSQVEALLSTLRPYLIAAQIDGQPPTLGNAHPEYAPHGIYPARTADAVEAWLSIAAANDRQWAALCHIAGSASFSRDPRFATASARQHHRDALDAAIAEWTSSHPRDALVRDLREAGVAASPVLPVEEQWHDPHYEARGIKATIEIPVYGREDVYRAPLKFSDYTPRVDRRGPLLGEHNKRVFGELLGLPDAEIDALQQAGIIA